MVTNLINTYGTHITFISVLLWYLRWGFCQRELFSSLYFSVRFLQNTTWIFTNTHKIARLPFQLLFLECLSRSGAYFHNKTNFCFINHFLHVNPDKSLKKNYYGQKIFQLLHYLLFLPKFNVPNPYSFSNILFLFLFW